MKHYHELKDAEIASILSYPLNWTDYIIEEKIDGECVHLRYNASLDILQTKSRNGVIWLDITELPLEHWHNTRRVTHSAIRALIDLHKPEEDFECHVEAVVGSGNNVSRYSCYGEDLSLYITGWDPHFVRGHIGEVVCHSVNGIVKYDREGRSVHDNVQVSTRIAAVSWLHDIGADIHKLIPLLTPGMTWPQASLRAAGAQADNIKKAREQRKAHLIDVQDRTIKHFQSKMAGMNNDAEGLVVSFRPRLGEDRPFAFKLVRSNWTQRHNQYQETFNNARMDGTDMLQNIPRWIIGEERERIITEAWHRQWKTENGR